MIKLREEQLRLFDELARSVFIDRMTDHIKIHFPHQVNCEEKELRIRVEALIDKAKSYQITDRKDVADFISLCCQFGDDFDVNGSTSWASQILNDEETNNGSLKVARLRRHVRAAHVSG